MIFELLFILGLSMFTGFGFLGLGAHMFTSQFPYSYWANAEVLFMILVYIGAGLMIAGATIALWVTVL